MVVQIQKVREKRVLKQEVASLKEKSTLGLFFKFCMLVASFSSKLSLSLEVFSSFLKDGLKKLILI